MEKGNSTTILIIASLLALLILIICSCTVVRTGQVDGVTSFERQKVLLVTQKKETKNFLCAKKYNYRADSFNPSSGYYYIFDMWNDRFEVGDTIMLYDFLKSDVYIKIKKK